MNIIDYTEELQSRLQQYELKDNEADLTRTGKTLSFIRDLLKELKKFTLHYKFKTMDEEILFFKTAKPILLSQFYYHKRKFALQLFDAFRDRKSRVENYNKTLRKMQSYIQKNQDFYEYCMSGSTYLDNSYFTRNNRPSISINCDEHFTTGFDSKLAKILNMEMMKSYVMECKRKLEETETPSNTSLTWTAQKIDLVELIYALHALGTFNNASLEVRQIVEVFEILFHVDLGNYYRTFVGLRMRKNSQTLFLDKMKERLEHRISEIDER